MERVAFPGHGKMLLRNSVYTAVTRERKFVVLMGRNERRGLR